MAELVGTIILNATGFGSIATTILFGSTTVAAVVGGAALVGGSIVGAALLSSAAAGPKALDFNVPKPSDGTQSLRQAISPRLAGYGRCRIAGVYVLYDTDPATGYSYDVIALHQGQIGGFVHYFLNDDLVTPNASTGQVPGASGFDDGRYENYPVIKTRLGLATETAYSEVVTGLPGVWTTAHRGDGVASAMLRCETPNSSIAFTKFPYGLPKLSVVADLAPLFDPREETQSRSDPTTWAQSHNPVIQLINYLTDADRGLGLDWDEIIAPNLTALMAQADYCDEAVTLANGTTEPRYRSSGWFYLTTDPADVIASILATCDGWMTESGTGAISLVVGKYVAPTVTLTDDHILGFSIDHGVADEELINQIKFTFNAPENDYREAPGVPWEDAASIAETGRIRPQQLSYTWVQSHSQGRRLAKRAMARNQARLRGTLQTSLYGLQALGSRWVGVQSTLISDLANAVIEISRARVDIINAQVSFDWILVNPNEIDAWDAATEEGLPPIMTGSLTNTRTLGTAVGYGGTNTNPAFAFDNSDATYAGGSDQVSGAVGKDWGSGVTKIIRRFVIKSQSGRSFANALTPREILWRIQGSSNGSSWTDIDTGTDTDGAFNTQKIIAHTTANTATAYRYHRVLLEFRVGGVLTSSAIAIANVQLYAVVPLS